MITNINYSTALEFKGPKGNVRYSKYIVAFKQTFSGREIVCLIKMNSRKFLAPDLSDVPANNVVKIDDTGKEVWVIKSLEELYGATYKDRRYVDMLWEGDDTILVDNKGDKYLLNEDDGSIQRGYSPKAVKEKIKVCEIDLSLPSEHKSTSPLTKLKNWFRG